MVLKIRVLRSLNPPSDVIQNNSVMNLFYNTMKKIIICRQV
jgi:hypothetical protein